MQYRTQIFYNEVVVQMYDNFITKLKKFLYSLNFFQSAVFYRYKENRFMMLG